MLLMLLLLMLCCCYYLLPLLLLLTAVPRPYTGPAHDSRCSGCGSRGVCLWWCVGDEGWRCEEGMKEGSVNRCRRAVLENSQASLCVIIC